MRSPHLRLLVRSLVLSSVAACADSPTAVSPEPSKALLVTDPMEVASTVSSEVVWVSLPPVTWPTAEFATVRVRGGSSAVTLATIDGGFDPIAIPATVDDTLDAILTSTAGDTTLFSIVPRNRRPMVVRTTPARGKKGVPLNALLSVVFSEPVDPGSVNAQTIRLQGPGGFLAGKLTTSPDGLRVEFEPVTLMEADASYTLIVDGVRDREGDSMEAAVLVAFATTQSAPPGTPGDLAADMLFVADLRTCPPGCQADAEIVSSLDIYRTNASAPPTRLTTHAAPDLHPSWSPDGKLILFQSERDGNSEIYVMNADGSAQTRLTNDASRDEEPSWSPDGSRIAFVSSRDGNAELYLMNKSGSAVSRLTNHPSSDHSPSWSPDGSRIVFSSERDGASEIYVLTLSDLSVTRLTNNVVPDVTPSWSPEGTRIAFSRFVPNGSSETECMTIEDEYATMCRWDIMVASTDGTGAYRLDLPTVPGVLEGWWRSVLVATQPSWSRDGSRIAASAFICLSDLGGADCHGRTRIIEMNSNGQGGVLYRRSGLVSLDYRFDPVETHPSWHP